MALGASYYWMSRPFTAANANFPQEVMHPDPKQRRKWCVTVGADRWSLQFCNRSVHPFNRFFTIGLYGISKGYAYSGPSAAARNVPLNDHAIPDTYAFLEEVVQSNPVTFKIDKIVLGVTMEGDFHVLCGDHQDLIAVYVMNGQSKWRINKGIAVPELISALFNTTLRNADMTHQLRMMHENPRSRYNNELDFQRFNRALWATDHSNLGVVHEYLGIHTLVELPYYVTLLGMNNMVIQGPPLHRDGDGF